uniref:Uncharacterized protein n=1 Tax=Tetradesmus obliquus TaxID=3088 RepID=A0A383VPQ4_TETOB|eukprot:jgi/Sobl393_1/2009/SZX66799.1
MRKKPAQQQQQQGSGEEKGYACWHAAAGAGAAGSKDPVLLLLLLLLMPKPDVGLTAFGAAVAMKRMQFTVYFSGPLHPLCLFTFCRLALNRAKDIAQQHPHGTLEARDCPADISSHLWHKLHNTPLDPT